MARKTVAVMGAGSTMGFAMARNLARAGFDVRAWNRTREKAEPLSDDGAEICDSPPQAAQSADVILTMLANADAVLESMLPALSSIERDAIWLQMSTVGESGTDKCIELASQHSITFIDAPVLGTKQPAEQGKLVVLASGPEAAREHVQPIFDAVGQRTMWIGDAGAGTRLKLVANSWVLTVVEGCAETIALAQGLGVDAALLLEAIEGGTLDLPYLRAKTKAILEHDFEPAFRLALAAKDMGLIEDAAERHGLDLPLFVTIRRRMEQGIEEHGDEDMIATYLASAPEGVGV